MKSFIFHTYNPKEARQELDDFASLLSDRNKELGERKDIQKFLYGWKNILCLLGTYDAQIGVGNLISTEFDLFGRLSPDLIVGKSTTNRYLFIELESAKKRSIFVQGNRKIRDWSPDFATGYNQILDWLWMCEKRNTDDEFFEDFGSHHISKTGLLVIGRDSFLDSKPSDRNRWDHRRKDSTCGEYQVSLSTYDTLLKSLEDQYKITLSFYGTPV